MRTVSLLIVVLFASALFAQPCDAQKPKFVFVTQRACLPCVKAKMVFESMQRDGTLDAYDCEQWDIRTDSSKIESTGAKVARTPTFLSLDKDGFAVNQINVNDETLLREFARQIPCDCIEATTIEPFEEALQEAPKAGEVVVTWDLATQYRSGTYNRTFAFNRVEYALNSFGLYWNIRYKRVSSGGQFHVVQASFDLGAGVAARTSGNTMLVSPVIRFVNETQSNMITCHENRHTHTMNHHSQDGGLMGPSGGYLLLPSDMRYFDRMTWKSAKRPWDNPGEFKAYLSGAKTLDDSEYQTVTIEQYHGSLKQ
jgi:hypothetical protein